MQAGIAVERRKNVHMYGKIFFFVLCVWINEVVTSAIAITHGLDETCKIRFVLDTPNAFFGVILFFIMIFSKRRARNRVLESVGLSMFTDQT